MSATLASLVALLGTFALGVVLLDIALGVDTLIIGGVFVLGVLYGIWMGNHAR